MTEAPRLGRLTERTIFVPSMRVESESSRAIVVKFSSRTPMTVRSLSRLPVSTVTVLSVVSSSTEIAGGPHARFARYAPARIGLFRL